MIHLKAWLAVTAASDEMADIREVIPIQDSSWILYVILALLVLVVVGYLVWPNHREAVPPPAPLEIARRDLAQLREHLEDFNLYEIGVHLSTIVRSYVGSIEGARLDTLTTAETVARCSASPRWNEARRDAFRSFLEACDRIKFSHAEDQTESSTLVRQAASIIEES